MTRLTEKPGLTPGQRATILEGEMRGIVHVNFATRSRCSCSDSDGLIYRQLRSRHVRPRTNTDSTVLWSCPRCGRVWGNAARFCRVIRRRIDDASN